MVEELSLQGRHILVVEDEFMIALSIRKTLEAFGAVVLGPVATVAKGLALVQDSPQVDAAVLDVNLGGNSVQPVAQALTERGVRYLLATGYGSGDLTAFFDDVPRCEKPFDDEQVVRTLVQMMASP